jgi:hypothetical protein
MLSASGLRPNRTHGLVRHAIESKAKPVPTHACEMPLRDNLKIARAGLQRAVTRFPVRKPRFDGIWLFQYGRVSFPKEKVKMKRSLDVERIQAPPKPHTRIGETRN